MEGTKYNHSPLFTIPLISEQFRTVHCNPVGVLPVRLANIWLHSLLFTHLTRNVHCGVSLTMGIYHRKYTAVGFFTTPKGVTYNAQHQGDFR